MEKIIITVDDYITGERIDKYLSRATEIDLSRTHLQRLIKDDMITINNKPIKSSYLTKENDVIEITFPEVIPTTIEPKDIPINIIYQDDDIAVLNKQPGIAVHCGAGNWNNTIVNALLFHLKGLSAIGGVERPGIVHRLDKDTSGLLIIAKNDKAHIKLSSDFAERTIHKEYTAVVIGKILNDHAIIDKPIKRNKQFRQKMSVSETGKSAKTEYFVLKRWESEGCFYNLLRIILHTGRTHQIRVHLSSSGHPIIGDPIYSRNWKRYTVPYLLLCANKIEFDHPITGDKMSFEIPLPDYMTAFIRSE